MPELMNGIKPPKKKDFLIQGRFLDGPLKGQVLTHTAHHDWSHPQMDGVNPPYVWPISIDSIVDKLEYKLTVEGLHEPLKVLPTDLNKQQRYYILYWEDFGRVHPQFGIIGTYRRVGVYKLTANPVSDKFVPAWKKDKPILSKAHPTSSATKIAKQYHTNNPDEWAPIDWEKVDTQPVWVDPPKDVDQHKWLTINEMPLEELLEEGSEDGE